MNTALIPLALVLGAWYAARMQSPRPWTIARLEASPTARRLGIDNSIPVELLPRARGLALVASRFEREGFRVTSAWRSQALTEAIYRESGRVKPYAGPGTHGEARALDFGGEPGHDGAEKLAMLRDRLLTSWAAPGVVGTVSEGDHLHVSFDGAWLESLAQNGGNS